MVNKIKQILQPIASGQTMRRRDYYIPEPPPGFVPRSDPSFYFTHRR